MEEIDFQVILASVRLQIEAMLPSQVLEFCAVVQQESMQHALRNMKEIENRE